MSLSIQNQINFANSNYPSNTSISKNSFDNRRAEKGNAINKNNMNERGKSLKKNARLENLMKIKESLIESKNSLLERTLKNGDSPLSIKDKLDSIDKQIEEVNKQISKLQLEEQQKKVGNDAKDKENKKTKELQKKDSSLDNLINLSKNLSKVKALSDKRILMVGEKRVLESEIKLDEGRGIDSVKKKERVSKIENNIEEIAKKIGHNLSSINNKKTSSMHEKNLSNSEYTENHDKLLIKHRIKESIKRYRDNLPDKDNDNEEKINVMA